MSSHSILAGQIEANRYFNKVDAADLAAIHVAYHAFDPGNKTKITQIVSRLLARHELGSASAQTVNDFLTRLRREHEASSKHSL